MHAVYLPELHVDLEAEGRRLRKVMDEIGCVNIFLAEGAGVADIVEELERSGTPVDRDAFGHVKLDTINPGKYFAQEFAQRIGAEKKMVQKSGYFFRSAAANETDLGMIAEFAELAVASALRGESRRDRSRRGPRRRAAGHGAEPGRWPQGLRRRPAVVHRRAALDRPALSLAAPHPGPAHRTAEGPRGTTRVWP